MVQLYLLTCRFYVEKGILIEDVRQKAIGMIDPEFGLELWAEAGKKTLAARKAKLEEFKKKLLSPQPPKRKIKPNVYTQRIFEDGDIIAVQLQTAKKPYTKAECHPLSEEEFHKLDGKYVLMQLINCPVSWTSSIVPEVKSYWACFRLFDGIFDHVPESIDVSELKEATIHQGQDISATFTCESSMFYFKRRHYRLIRNQKDIIANYEPKGDNTIFWGINMPWENPDSQLVAAMGTHIECFEYKGALEEIKEICKSANRYGRFNYNLSADENNERFEAEEKTILEKINNTVANGGKLYGISFCINIGIVTIKNGHIDNLYIQWRYQRNGFGTRLLNYAFSIAGTNAYIDVPKSHKVLLRICEKLELVKMLENEHSVRMVKS